MLINQILCIGKQMIKFARGLIDSLAATNNSMHDCFDSLKLQIQHHQSQAAQTEENNTGPINKPCVGNPDPNNLDNADLNNASSHEFIPEIESEYVDPIPPSALFNPPIVRIKVRPKKDKSKPYEKVPPKTKANKSKRKAVVYVSSK